MCVCAGEGGGGEGEGEGAYGLSMASYLDAIRLTRDGGGASDTCRVRLKALDE